MALNSISTISAHAISNGEESKVKVEEAETRSAISSVDEGNKVQEVIYDSITSIEILDLSCDEKIEKFEETKQFTTKDALKLTFMFIGIIGICVLFIIPWTMIPRTDSIVYQSHGLEICLPLVTLWILTAAANMLDLIIWTKEKSLATFRVFFIMFLMYYIPCILILVSSYIVWTVNLGLNVPIPYIALTGTLPIWIIFQVLLWFFLPAEVLRKQDFKRKLRIYVGYFVWFLVTLILVEVLSYLFFSLPANMQLLVPFLIAACREIDFRIRSKIVEKMMGEIDEPASALVDVTVNGVYAFFITIRLADAEIATVFTVVAIDFILHLRLTYQIINEHRKVAVENDGGNSRKMLYLVQLVLSELLEGFIPIIHGICIAMQYHGPNANLFSNIGSNYWGKKIEDLSLVYKSMMILFTFDIISVITTSLLLWMAIGVNMLQEFYRVIRKYWVFMIVKFAASQIAFLAMSDINCGMDTSGNFRWIDDIGWRGLINESNSLTNDEKIHLLYNSMLE